MPPPSYNSQYQDAGQAISGFGDSLNHIVLGVAQQRWRQQMMQQQFELKRQEMMQQQKLYDAHARAYETQAALDAANTALTNTKVKNATEAQSSGGIIGDVLDYLQRNPNMTPEEKAPYMGTLLQHTSRLTAGGNEHAPLNVAQLQAMLNPAAIPGLAAGGVDKLYHNVPPGNVGVSPTQPTVVGGYNIPQGNIHVGPAQVGTDVADWFTNPQQTQGLPPRVSTGADPLIGELRAQQAIAESYLRSTPAKVNDPTYQAATNSIADLQNRLTQRRNNTTPQTIKAPGAAPAIGEIKRGYRFKGGEPNNPNSWEPVQGPQAQTIKAPESSHVAGEVRRGYRFKGGDVLNPDNWEKVQ